jgi:hypothetical protein
VSIILGRIVNHQVTKKIRWWQIKVDPSLFKIEEWFYDNKGQMTFTWSPYQKDLSIWFRGLSVVDSYVKEGDKIVLWVHGSTFGIIAVGYVADAPYYDYVDEKQLGYYVHGYDLYEKIQQIDIIFTHIFDGYPISSNFCFELGVSDNRQPLYPRWPLFTPSPMRQGFTAYYPGKLQTYRLPAIHPIWEEVWVKIIDIIESGDWSTI